MSSELLVRVHLDWTAPNHYDSTHSAPCRLGDGPTKMRDATGQPCHKRCAEDEIVRELLGHGRALIADERFAAPTSREPLAGGPR